MVKVRWVLAFMVLGLLVATQSFAETSEQKMISKSDHEGLAKYYDQQARDLREKAKQWEFTAEFYEKHPDPEAKNDSVQHAAHSRTIAQEYRKAADEAVALAREHRSIRPRLRQ